jgi:hypothetical protein
VRAVVGSSELGESDLRVMNASIGSTNDLVA